MNNVSDPASPGASGQTRMTHKILCEFESVRWLHVCDSEKGWTCEGLGGALYLPCTDWITVSDCCGVVSLTANQRGSQEALRLITSNHHTAKSEEKRIKLETSDAVWIFFCYLKQWVRLPVGSFPRDPNGGTRQESPAGFIHHDSFCVLALNSCCFLILVTYWLWNNNMNKVSYCAKIIINVSMCSLTSGSSKMSLWSMLLLLAPHIKIVHAYSCETSPLYWQQCQPGAGFILSAFFVTFQKIEALY